MCGIAGFVSQAAPPNAAGILERMTAAIRHRGPDDSGFLHGPTAFLGHRRLSIVDVAGGHQPLYNEDRSRAIVFNGEIFNHAEVRPGLERAGHQYRTRSDTETILHAWEEYGPVCVERFRGMFAFAIWDADRRRLFAARDRFGIKPFYYFRDGETFVFASEIKALLEHPAVPKEPNLAALGEYLAFGYVSGEETLFRGIRKLMPGHWLEWNVDEASRAATRIERYWDIEPAEGLDFDEAGWIAETRRRLEETVELRLMADVPLGTFLSGGVDSSAITALVQRLSGGRTESFSVGYAETAYSELAYARQVAERLGTVHREVTVGRDDFFDALPALIWHEDEPVTWPSSVPLYFVSKLASQHVKVVLTGEGADELFGGYERYRWNRINLRAAAAYGWAPGPVRRGIRRGIETLPLLSADARRKLGHTIFGRDLTVESLYLENFYCAFGSRERAALGEGSSGAYSTFMAHWAAARERSMLGRMLYADQKTYLVQLLMKQDRMSMAASIESRVPFLDHQFAAFAAAMPDGLKIRGSEQKYALKRAVEDLLPRDIVYRRKMGFPTPLKQWLREPSAAEALRPLTSARSAVREWVDGVAIERLIDRHQRGLDDGTDRIWRLLNLSLWGEIFFGAGVDAGRALERLAAR